MNRLWLVASLAFLSLMVLPLPDLLSSPVDSCTYFVEGQVLDVATQEPLPYASVQVKGLSQGGQTNEQGYFRIEHLCRREFDLIVSYVGYETAIRHHDTYHAAPRILLAHDSITLKSVTVEGKRTEGDLYSGTVQGGVKVAIPPYWL